MNAVRIPLALAALMALLMSTLPPLWAQEARSPAVIAELGREAYREGDYKKAQASFESLIEQGHTSGPLYFNLGNTYYRMGEIDKAILAYRRAQLYLPRDGDIEANLEHVRQEVEDKLEVEDGSVGLRQLVFWYDGLTLQEQTWMTLVLGAFAWAGLFLWRLRGKGRLPLSVPVLLVATAITATTTGVRHYELTRSPGAVVIHPEITARSGTDAKSVALFYLHAGAEVTARGDLDGDWLQIELPDGQRGWVERRFIGLVRP